jgi:hypothetical protein
MIVLMGKSNYGNRKQGGGYAKPTQPYKSPAGHIYKWYPLKGEVKCEHGERGQICGQAHATTMHETVTTLKERAKTSKFKPRMPWANRQAGQAHL